MGDGSGELLAYGVLSLAGDTADLDNLTVSAGWARQGIGRWLLATLIDLRLNETSYWLTVVATVFLPLTFITGFFGMNFGWMVDQLDSEIAFVLLGLAVPVATAVLAWRFLVRRFLLGDAPEPRRR